jgi:hypothetical protein
MDVSPRGARPIGRGTRREAPRRLLVNHAIRPVLVLLFVTLAACGGGGAGSGTGTVSMKITDAPFPATADCLAAARVEIDQVSARRGEDEWVTIPLADASASSMTLDLLQLRAGLQDSLALGEVPTGAYSEVRLRVVRAVLEFTDGSTPVEFKIPSGSSSGLKLKLEPPLLVAGGQTAQLVLDVDLSSSFHTAGLGGDPTCDELKQGEAKVLFRPVIHVHNAAEIGLVLGTVFAADGTTPAPDVEVSAFPVGTVVDGTTVPTALTFSSPAGLDLVVEGSYALLLPPGEYDLYVRAQGVEGRTLARDALVVVAGDTLDANDLTLPAAP